MSDSTSDVLFEVKQKTGFATLNRPKALNALNLSMIQKLSPQLKEWETDSNINQVIIKGSGGKAFCAGGDVKYLSQEGLKGNHVGMEFFRNEYSMNYLIGTYRKPYIAFLDGITMGGGVGLSVHGKYRVATEKTLFAMPETAIGLFPDVGGTHFLPRLSNRLGFYLALTGERLKGEDVFQAGIATHFVPSEKLNDLEQALINSNEPEEILKKFHQIPTKPFSLNPILDKIAKCFAPNSLGEIIVNLKNDNSDWGLKTLQNLNKMSPLSVAVSFEALVRGSQKDLHDCLKVSENIEKKKIFCESNRFV